MSVHNQSQQEQQQTVLVSETYAINHMYPVLGRFDMFALYLLIVFFVTNVPLAVAGGVASLTYWLLAAITFFIPCVIATAQLGVLLPHEGSLYNWTHRAFGGYWSFFVAFCAWFPGVLVIVTGADTVVTFIQGFNSQWLAAFWQQWLVVLGIIAFSTLLSVQRLRITSHIANAAVWLIILAVVIIVFAGVIWLLKGHPSATNFGHLADWGINTGNFFAYGLIALAYLGFEVPLNMAGELHGRGTARGRKTIIHHLLWGTVFIIVGYLLVSFALLVTQSGTAASNTGNYALVNTVGMALGKGWSVFVAGCIICFFLIVPMVYNYTFARLLMVAAVDQRLPAWLGKLNTHRVPANAMIFQAAIASGLATIIFLIVPYAIHIGDPTTLTTQVYAVSQASATLVWAIASAFLFFSLYRILHKNWRTLKKQLIVPPVLLWYSITIGPIMCLITIIDTLTNSWTGLISNADWLLVVGAFTIFWLIIALTGSMVASSETIWESAFEGEQDPSEATLAEETLWASGQNHHPNRFGSL